MMLPDPWQGLVHPAAIMIWVPIMLPPLWQVLVHPAAIIVWVPIMLSLCGKYWCTHAAATHIKKNLLLAAASSFSLVRMDSAGSQLVDCKLY